MRPTLANSPLLSHLITDFLLRNQVQVLPEGNCVREDDGHSWKTMNDNCFKIRMDKEQRNG